MALSTEQSDKARHILNRAQAAERHTIKPGRRLYLTAAGDVVESDHPDVHSLLVSAHGLLPATLAAELGITEGKPEPQAAAPAKPDEGVPSGLTIVKATKPEPVELKTPEAKKGVSNAQNKCVMSN